MHELVGKVHETLEQFDLKLAHRAQGYIEGRYEQKDDLLDVGARFDKKLGYWYIPNDAKIKDFKDFKTGFVLSDGKYHTMSHYLPDLDVETLQQRLGTFDAKIQPQLFAWKLTYTTVPLRPLRGKKERGLWDQFLSERRVNPTLSRKEFLLLMARMDPLTVALFIASRKDDAAFNP